MAITDRPAEFVDPALGRGVAAAGDDDDFVDDDLTRPGTVGVDPLAQLAELAEPVVLESRTLPHRYRPPWAVRYSIAVDFDDVKRWQKSAKARGAAGKRGEVDEVRFACIVLANLCECLIRDGRDVIDGQGEPVTFAHGSMRRMYAADKVAEVVRRFYGNDPYLVATVDTLLAEAGVGEEVEMVDPTNGSDD